MRRWLILLTLSMSAPAWAARLTGLAMTTGVVTITADGPPAVATQFALDGGYRLVVDLPAVIDAPLVADGTGSVIRLRAAMFAPGVARLVMDLSAPLEITSARSSVNGLTLTLRRVSTDSFATAIKAGRRPLPVLSGGAVTSPPMTPPASVPSPAPAAASGFDLPPDMFPPPGAKVPPEPVAAAQTTLATPDIPLAIPQALPPRSSRKRNTGVRPRNGAKALVVIDAGHGGKDVGAISVSGGYEKDVTLAIARATAAALQKSGKVRVRLTRDDDRFIPLGGRVKIAQLARADLFISIHADAAPNPNARGASVYTLSSVASDAVAARLAARENKADIIGGVNLGVEAPDVGDIMIDLSRRATGNVSVLFADILQDALSDRIRFRGEFHHFAGFYVLKAPDVPSVLLETGYVSNVEDAELLFSAAGRKRIAAGVARAIERHLVGD